jgi:putative nucleotidyltransferase with HDIG domain
MSLELSLAQQDALAETLRRGRMRLTPGERLAAGLGAALFACAEAALIAAHPPGSTHVLATVLCVLILAATFRIRIDLPFGFTVPSQLAFVPLVFAAAPMLVAPLVVLALLLSALVDVPRGQLSLGRLAWAPANASFAFGPLLVVAISGVDARSASPVLLLVGMIAQFATDFGVSALRMSLTREATLREQLGDTWVYAIDAGFSWIGLIIAQQMLVQPAAVLSLAPLMVMLQIFAGERRQRLQSMIELGNAYRGTALVLGDVVEADDGYTGEHCRSVVALALAVGSDLGLGAERQRNLEFAALLHDVGKIAIPKAIINKPGKLDPHEWTVIKTHTVEGQKMLDRVGGFMRDVGLIVRSHHERWDGQGYPDCLAGEAIPLEARIVAACDTWNAMRTDRAYRKALTYEQAMAELLAGSGTQFDPKVVKSLIRVIDADQPAGDPRPRGPGDGEDGPHLMAA